MIQPRLSTPPPLTTTAGASGVAGQSAHHQDHTQQPHRTFQGAAYAGRGTLYTKPDGSLDPRRASGLPCVARCDPPQRQEQLGLALDASHRADAHASIARGISASAGYNLACSRTLDSRSHDNLRGRKRQSPAQWPGFSLGYSFTIPRLSTPLNSPCASASRSGFPSNLRR